MENCEVSTVISFQPLNPSAPDWQALNEIYQGSGYADMETDPDVEIEHGIIAMDEDIPAGFITWSDLQDGYWVKARELAVIRKYQGSILAWRLVKSMAAAAKLQGAKAIMFSVRQDNKRFLRMVNKVGAVQYGINGHYNFYYIPLV